MKRKTDPIIWAEWNPEGFKADLMGKVEAAMEEAAQFAEDRARELVPERTGLLAEDISHEVEARAGEVWGAVGVKQGSKAFYAWMVEMGTRTSAAHPFLRPAVFNNWKEILRIITGKG